MNLNTSFIKRLGFLVFQGVVLFGAFGFLFSGVHFLNNTILSPQIISAVDLAYNTCVGGRCITVNGFGVSDCDINNANSCLNAPSRLSCGRPAPGAGFVCMYDPNGIQSCNEGEACPGDPGITGAKCRWFGGVNNQCEADPFGRDTCTPGAACGGFGGGDIPPPLPGPNGDGGNGGGGGGPAVFARCVAGTTNNTGTCLESNVGPSNCTLGQACNVTNPGTGVSCVPLGVGVGFCMANPLGNDSCTLNAACSTSPNPNPNPNPGTHYRCIPGQGGQGICAEDPSGPDNCSIANASCSVTDEGTNDKAMYTNCFVDPTDPMGRGVCVQTTDPNPSNPCLSFAQTCYVLPVPPPNPTPTPTGKACVNNQCVAQSSGTSDCTLGATCTLPAPTGRCSSPGVCNYDPSASGPSCSSPTDCPANMQAVCSVNGTCSIYGVSGKLCVSPSDCAQPQKPLCNANKKCVLMDATTTGTPCTLGNDSTCLQPLGCSGLACVPGGSGNSCTTPADCVPKPGIPHCAGLTCNENVSQGNICSSYKDCQPPLGCNQYQQCVYGGTLGTCKNNAECIPPLGCNTSTQQCVPNGGGGNCYTNADCKKPLGCDLAYKKCVPGGNDGACSNNADCEPKPRCNDITQKCVPGGTGSVCSKESDCQVTRCTPSEPYQCVPYNQGGTGRVCSLNSSNPDKICQPPPKKGRIVINKFTKGGDDAFSFYVNPSPVAATLSTSGSSATVWGRATTYFDVDPGTKENPIRYNIAEILPDHWNFTGANCDRSFILTTNSVEEVSVESEETTTCNFYNVKNGSIKIINNNLSYPNQSTETAEYAIFPSPIYETITTNGPSGQGINHEMVPGTYAIYQNTPIDWNLVNVTCNQSNASVQVPAPVVNGTITVTVLPGTTITCTFNNKFAEGNLMINKYAEGGAGSQQFPFNITRTGLNGGRVQVESINVVSGSFNFKNLTLPPGTYNISEDLPDGWVLSKFDCTGATYDSSDNGPINVSITEGKPVVCSFYNTKKGYLKIIKEATDGDDTFNYKIENYSSSQSNGQPAGKPLTTDAKITTTNGKGVSELLVENQGEYNIIEEMPAGWKSNGAIVCDKGTFVQATGDVYGVLGVRVTNGETTTCTFKNIKKGKPILKIKKEAIGGDATFSYKIENESQGIPTAPLTTSGSVTTTGGKGLSKDLPLNPGGYNITEDLSSLADWSLTSAQCVKQDGSTTGAVDLANKRITSVYLVDGETTTCTFRNYKSGSTGTLKIVKETDGQDASVENFYFNIDVATFGLSSDKAKNGNTTVSVSRPAPGKTIGVGNSTALEEEPGTYNIAEDISKLPEGWSLESAYCDRGSFTMTDTGVMNVQIVVGATTTCTFRNSKKGTLVIKKKTGTAGDDEFIFSVTPGINDIVRIKTKNGQGGNDGNCVSGSASGSSTSPTNSCSDGSLPNSPNLSLPRNSYTITEKKSGSWSISSVTCSKQDKTPTGIFNSGSNSISNVIVEAGQTTTCTFENAIPQSFIPPRGGGYRGDKDNEPPLPEPNDPQY